MEDATSTATPWPTSGNPDLCKARDTASERMIGSFLMPMIEGKLQDPFTVHCQNF